MKNRQLKKKYAKMLKSYYNMIVYDYEVYHKTYKEFIKLALKSSKQGQIIFKTIHDNICSEF